MPFNQQVTFPCELKLRAQGGALRLTRQPVAEISTLHTGTTTWSGALNPGTPLTLARDGGAFHLLLTLDVLGAPGPRRASRRWTLTHLIEETGRHAGHADILRELADGTTGR
jgi:hypothetical protein